MGIKGVSYFQVKPHRLDHVEHYGILWLAFSHDNQKFNLAISSSLFPYKKRRTTSRCLFLVSIPVAIPLDCFLYPMDIVPTHLRHAQHPLLAQQWSWIAIMTTVAKLAIDIITAIRIIRWFQTMTIIQGNTSSCPRHFQNIVNNRSFWHSWKAQVGCVCVTASVILNPNTP